MRADLASGDWAAVVEARPDVVFLCAALTSMQTCEEDPVLAGRVNVDAPVELAARLMEQGAFVVFLSSNTVFDGNTPDPDEASPPSPGNAYGRQKARAEAGLRAIRGADRRLAVVRLSKVLVPDAGVPGTFRRKLEAGQTCDAFDDLLLCPVSATFVVNGLRIVAMRREAGIFHLSGAATLSYADFARELARQFGWDPALVRATSGGALPFRPRFPALGMGRTRERLGVAPESAEDFWRHFRSEAAESLERAG